MTRPPTVPAADTLLLARFRGDGDGSAFAELVRRHGPLVWGVCRRGLANPADAEDAFQATFLVLVRRADQVAGHPALGPWLHRVARYAVRNAQRANRRRLARVATLAHDPAADPTPAADARADVDDALSRLPDRLRGPVILCHLQGLTRAEAAARLGCPEGTLSSLLAEALRRLRRRLRPDPAAALAIAGATAVPPGLAAAAARAAVIYSTSTTGLSPAVAGLTEGVLRMFAVKKWVAVAAAVVALGGLTAGVAWQYGRAAEPPKEADTKWVEGLDTKRTELKAEIEQIRLLSRALEHRLKSAEDALKQVDDALAKQRAGGRSAVRWQIDVLPDDEQRPHTVWVQLLAADGTVLGDMHLDDGLIPIVLARLPIPARRMAEPAAVVVRPVKEAPAARLRAVQEALKKAGAPALDTAPAGGVPWNQRRERVPTEAEIDALFGRPPAKK